MRGAGPSRSRYCLRLRIGLGGWVSDAASEMIKPAALPASPRRSAGFQSIT